MMKFIFGMQTNICTSVKDEYDFLPAAKHQIDAIILVVSRHAQVTQNKFASSLQYLKKEGNDEVDFYMQISFESFLQINCIIFDEDGKAFPKFPK